jgi:DNA-binding NtrC family response regulator
VGDACRALRQASAEESLIKNKEGKTMGYNILVVEDTRDWRVKLVGYLLEEGEYNVTEAEDYETATELIRNQPLDVALIDIRLIDWDERNAQGMQLLRQLDEVSEINGTQSIVITGYGSAGLMREAFRDHKVVDFIEKQAFDPDEFRTIVLRAAVTARELRGEIIDRKYK